MFMSSPSFDTSDPRGGTTWNVNGNVQQGQTRIGRDQVNGGSITYSYGERARAPRASALTKLERLAKIDFRNDRDTETFDSPK